MTNRRQGRDLATGIVLGAALGLSALFLYLSTTSRDDHRRRRDRAVWLDLRRQHGLATARDRLRRAGPFAGRFGLPASAAELDKPELAAAQGTPARLIG